MATHSPDEQSFRTRLEGSEKGRVYVVVPFDPQQVWGARDRYHIHGTINGRTVRGALQKFAKGWFLPLGPAYRRDAGLHAGDPVEVTIALEGPQSDALAPDIAAALASDLEAKRFFDSLASFYRQNYLRWIDATKRSPETRAKRIAELVRFMKDGVKQRPH